LLIVDACNIPALPGAVRAMPRILGLDWFAGRSAVLTGSQDASAASTASSLQC